jgi:hypothetical protein
MINTTDIIQITDEHHPWYACLLVVSEVKFWGVVAYIAIPESNDGSKRPAPAFNRLNYNQFKKVGKATVILGETL